MDLAVPERFSQLSSDYSKEKLPFQLIITRNSWPGNDTAINFTYSLVRYEKRITELLVKFEEPGSVSNNNIKDSFEIVFNDSYCFTTVQNISLPTNFRLSGLLPYQDT